VMVIPVCRRISSILAASSGSSRALIRVLMSYEVYDTEHPIATARIAAPAQPIPKISLISWGALTSSWS
jgi:hypothetical protein